MTDTGPQPLDLPDAEVVYFPGFFPAPVADRLFRELLGATHWRQDRITLYGKPIDLPRLTAWYGDAGTGYTYSGIANDPLPWTPPPVEVKHAVEGPAGVAFNSVLLNRYRTGRDSVSWHADDEPEFGENPVIASVSFGGTRVFQLKHKTRLDLKAGVDLSHGSLLLMRGATQHHWWHRVPKTARDVPERISLTFRVVRATDGPRRPT